MPNTLYLCCCCRFWGTPIPIWASEDGEEIRVIGSIEELSEVAGRPVSELLLPWRLVCVLTFVLIYITYARTVWLCGYICGYQSDVQVIDPHRGFIIGIITISCQQGRAPPTSPFHLPPS
jgi:hypothetical protein